MRWIDSPSDSRLPGRKLLHAARLFGGTGVLLLLIASAGLWVGLVYRLEDSWQRNAVMIGMAAIVSVIFVWMLLVAIRRFLSRSGHWGIELSIATLNLGLLLAAFAAIYSRIGIHDSSQDGAIIRDYGTCFYFSVTTFTTLGYGDFYPSRLVRPLTAIQSLVGYVVLGLIASVGASIIRRWAEDELEAEKDEGDER